MKDFYFDLLAPPRHLAYLRAGLLLLGSLALAGAIAYNQVRLYPALNAQRERLQTELTRQSSSVAVATLKPTELAQAWQRARSIAMQLDRPWQRLFAALASASKGGHVALISIEPDPHHVLLVAEARDLESMLGFVSALQVQPDFSEALLQSHSIDQTQAEKPVRFRVLASWRSAE